MLHWVWQIHSLSSVNFLLNTSPMIRILIVKKPRVYVQWIWYNKRFFTSSLHKYLFLRKDHINLIQFLDNFRYFCRKTFPFNAAFQRLKYYFLRTENLDEVCILYQGLHASWNCLNFKNLCWRPGISLKKRFL
mgnify:CR=1 FL=1